MKNAKSMKFRLVIPFCLILIFQTAFMMFFLSNGTVARNLYLNEMNSLEKDAQNSDLLLEREMVQHWMTDIRTSSKVQKQIAELLKESGKSAADIRSDWQLNSEILRKITPALLELLHRSYGNGIYVILDGPAADQSIEGHQAGVSIMDSDSSSFAADNSDLQLVRGISAISTDQEIPLAREWQMDFDMTGTSAEDYQFYEPFRLAVNQTVSMQTAASYAYLSDISKILQSDTAGVSYSVPLVLDDGSVIGVLGGTMMKGQIAALLKNEISRSDADTLQLIAKKKRIRLR